MESAHATGARVGIDVGGTYTDAACIDDRGVVHIAKVRTRKRDIAAGFMDGLDEVTSRAGTTPADLGFVGHGTTVATNAIVQRDLAKVALVTNAGFTDVLEIGTMQRADSYDLQVPKPAPLVAREHCYGVTARIGPDGQELAPVDEDEVRAIAAALRAGGVESVAVCLLFSFVNREHERHVGALLAHELPGVPISLSSVVAPEVREYVRASTTAINAALLPLVGSYLDGLVGDVRERGLKVPVHLMQSNGGVSTAPVTAHLPVALASSGPAAAVMGAARITTPDGYDNLLTFDMGGTTIDVALVKDGRPSIRFSATIDGLPLNMPQIDVVSIGAGGGSIATVDAGGRLRVGPESAGADPGPAAYGVGGERATVTDAHVVLGHLAAGRALAGGIVIDRDRAAAAIERDVALPLDLDAEAAAAAVLRVVNANMSNAARLVSVGRGEDPRALALVALGGAGPMHSCAVAEELGMTTVIVPRYPGITAALGLLVSDMRHDLRRTWVRPTAAIDPAELDAVLAELEAEARELLERAGRSDGEIAIEVDMRYQGQAYNLTVPFPPRPATDASVVAIERAFAEAHVAAYDYTPTVTDMELVTLRVHASAPARTTDWAQTGRQDAPIDARSIWLKGDWCEVPTFARDAVPDGASGPLVIEQEDATTLVPPGWSVRSTAIGNLLLERSPA